MIIHNHNALRPHVSCEPSLFSHHRGLFAHAVALTRNSFEAEDLVQETYVRAIQAKGRLREGSNLRPGFTPSSETSISTTRGKSATAPG